MKSKHALPVVFASVIAFALIFAVAPSAMADSEDGAKSYKRHWAITIDNAGSVPITEQDTRASLKEKALSLDELDLSDYQDITKARLGKAIHEDQYYLVWKLISVDYNEDTDTSIKTIYVLDAATGVSLLDEPITKEGGSCHKNKSKVSETSGEQA